MSVKAACNHDTKVVTLHVWDAERGRAFTEETIAIPFSEVQLAQDRLDFENDPKIRAFRAKRSP